MTISTHTPGPWDAQPLQYDHGASIAIVAPDNGYIVAIVPFDEDIQTVDEPNMHTVNRRPCDTPNACLLATAPDLLEAGEDVIATWEKGDLSAAVRKLDRAIAKARGRQ